MNTSDKTILTIVQIIRGVIIGEIGRLIYPEDKKSPDIFQQSVPYIKFQPVIAAIEFLGACYDELPFEQTRLDTVRDLVEDRFNKAIKELLPKYYLRYTKADHQFYFYKKLRCNMIHQLRPGKGIFFTTRLEACEGGYKHLQKIDQGLLLVLEDFYDDLHVACNRILRLFETNKLTNKKGDVAFIEIIPYPIN